MSHISKEEIAANITKAVDSLSGKNRTVINMIGVGNFDITSAEFLTRDPNGLIKGFEKEPYFDHIHSAYLVSNGTALFNARGNPGSATMIKISELADDDRMETEAYISRVVDNLTGILGSQIEATGVANKSRVDEVNWISRDAKGLVKGFVDRPFLDKDREYDIYVEDAGAVFSVHGAINSSCLVEMPWSVDAKEESVEEAKPETPVENERKLTIEDLLLLMMTGKNAIILPNIGLEAKQDIFEMVVRIFADEDPHINLNVDGTGDIRIERGPVFIFGRGFDEESGKPHKRVFEYDGLFHCLDCDQMWGAGFNCPKDAPMVCE